MPPLKLLKLRSRSKDQPDQGTSSSPVSNMDDSKEDHRSKKTDSSVSYLELDRLSLSSEQTEAGSSRSTLDECSSIASTQCAYSSTPGSREDNLEFEEESDEEDTQSVTTARSVSLASEDTVIGCNMKRKTKKQKSKDEKLRQEMIENSKMWNASDTQVLEHLLWSRGSLEGWRTVAAARGLCSLSEGCTCPDCQQNQGYLQTDLDGDGGLGAGVPIFTAAMAPACTIQ